MHLGRVNHLDGAGVTEWHRVPDDWQLSKQEAGWVFEAQEPAPWVPPGGSLWRMSYLRPMPLGLAPRLIVLLPEPDATCAAAGRAGGQARARKLTRAQRVAIGRAAVAARWARRAVNSAG